MNDRRYKIGSDLKISRSSLRGGEFWQVFYTARGDVGANTICGFGREWYGIMLRNFPGADRQAADKLQEQENR